jgi:hypothetical protein
VADESAKGRARESRPTLPPSPNATKTQPVDKKENDAPDAPVVLEWFSVCKIGDNDYRVVKQKAPILRSAEFGIPMRLPAEVWERWQVDAEEMLSQKISEW